MLLLKRPSGSAQTAAFTEGTWISKVSMHVPKESNTGEHYGRPG